MKNRGQIWVETVIYVLIALIMIGTVLGIAKPKIEEMQDKLAIERTIEMMEEINAQISSAIEGGVGNKRVISIEIKKGELKIDEGGDKIIFTMEESKSTYSEPGKDIPLGAITVHTEKTGKLNRITLTMDYDYNLVTEESPLVLTKSASKYKLSIENIGNSQIEIKKIS